jgi:uncharacterized protein YutE (UPF0331/DUF86 family)
MTRIDPPDTLVSYQRVEKYLDELEYCQTHFRDLAQALVFQRVLERAFQLAMDAILDLSRIYTQSDDEGETKKTASQVMESMKAFVPPDLAGQFARRHVAVRNHIVHDPETISLSSLMDQASDLLNDGKELLASLTAVAPCPNCGIPLRFDSSHRSGVEYERRECRCNFEVYSLQPAALRLVRTLEDVARALEARCKPLLDRARETRQPAWLEGDRVIALHLFEKAFRLYQEAADLACPRAFLELGDAYRWGRGCERDKEKALVSYTYGAELGDNCCRARLACFHFEEGRRVEAGEWWERYFQGAQLDGHECLEYLLQFGATDACRSHRERLRSVKEGIVYWCQWNIDYAVEHPLPNVARYSAVLQQAEAL